MRFSAAIFDLIGTLVENFSARAFRQLLRDMAAAVGAPPDDFTRLWIASFDDRMRGAFASNEDNAAHVCKTLGVNPDPDRIAQAARLMLDFRRRTLIPRPDAVETLTQLKAAGLKIGLISDCSPEVPTIWQETPLAPLVDAALFSCLVRLKKPDPRIYLLACERLQVEPRHCLFIGDGGSQELTGAAAVGMSAVLINVPQTDPYRHDTEHQHWQGESVCALSEVVTLVRG